jgi:glycosyltransferase involved in cell wall biosynthesis
MIRIAYIGTYVPQKCGIATYTHHLRQSVRSAKGWQGLDPVFAVRTAGTMQGDSDPAIYELDKEDRRAYKKLAKRLNQSPVDVVSLQHEFGIFGGEAGEYALDLTEHLDKPLAVTFHTVFEEPPEPYRSVQERIARRGDLILVMNRRAGEFLRRAFRIPAEKIRYVPHGTPKPAPEKREACREAMGWTSRKVVMSFGLLGRGKGYETVLRALPSVISKVPNVLYAIVGQTHPEVRKREGEAYREALRDLIRQLGLEEHVAMVDRYVEEEELTALLSACDLYVTPYPGLQQITSGTLAYAVGLGRPVLSTPYSYAADLLGAYPELLPPPEDAQRWAAAMAGILADERQLERIGREMGRIGSDMHWPKVGKLHLDLFLRLAGKEPATQVPMLKANGA